MAKHIVLVGGGHAHLTAILRISDYVKAGHRVTLVGPKPYQYYSGMGPGMLSDIYRPREIRFNIRKMVESRGGTFIEDAVASAEPEKNTLHLTSGIEITYDVVSFNIGSDIPISHIEIAENAMAFTVKPIINLLSVKKLVRDWPADKPLHVMVAGGGPAGTEVAGNLHRLATDRGLKTEITLASAGRLLKNVPERVRAIAMRSLTGRGIKVLEEVMLKSIMYHAAVLSDGREIPADFSIMAIGVKPPALFKDSGFETGPDGGLLVDNKLQSTSHPGVFGGGDCISFSEQQLAKAGVYAVRQNPVLAANIHACADGTPLETFDPGGRYLLVMNMGDGKGIFWKGGIVFDGRLAFRIKDYIDRMFMRRFQVSGEHAEDDNL